MKFSQRIKYYN